MDLGADVCARGLLNMTRREETRRWGREIGVLDFLNVRRCCSADARLPEIIAVVKIVIFHFHGHW